MRHFTLQQAIPVLGEGWSGSRPRRPSKKPRTSETVKQQVVVVLVYPLIQHSAGELETLAGTDGPGVPARAA
jgi:hypothetical protein